MNKKTPENTTPSVDPNAPQLHPSDLVACRDIIKVAIERGTFKAEEISIVGTAFDHINKFVEAMLANIKAASDTKEKEPPQKVTLPPEILSGEIVDAPPGMFSNKEEDAPIKSAKKNKKSK